MQFTPRSAEDIASDNLFPEGEYDFEVISATDEISKSSGNEMIHLKLRVYHPNGSGRFVLVDDYLLESVAFKLRHACDATGLTTEYETGSLEAHEFEGRAGRVKLRVQKSEIYQDKNAVKDYVPAGKPAAKQKAAGRPAQAGQSTNTGVLIEDEIPF